VKVNDLPEDLQALGAAFLIGLVSGAAVAFFTDVFVWSNKFRYVLATNYPHLFALVSVSSILFTAYFLKKLLGTLHGSSTSYVVRSYHAKLGYIGKKELAVYTLGSITSALGGAVVGPEGPGIALGAFFGYWLAWWLGARGEELKRMVLVGAAAGVASVFRAPLTAMAFAMEVPYKRAIEGGIFLQALVATLTSYLVTVFLAGPQRLLLVSRPFKPPYPSLDVVLASLGVGGTAAALTYIIYFIKHKSGELSDKFVRRRYWFVPPLALSLLIIASTFLVSPLVPGAGDLLTEKVFNEPESLEEETLALVAVAKSLLLPLSLTWGATGGLFMPLVSIGSALGLLYAKFFSIHTVEPIMIAGVSSLFASSMKTLLTSVLIGVEFLGFGAFFTSTVAASVGYLLTLPVSLVAGQLPEPQDIKKRSIIEIYLKLKEKKGFEKALRVEVENIVNKNVLRFTENMTVAEALDLAAKETHNHYPVVDANDKLVGEVSLEELIVEEPSKRIKEIMYLPRVIVYKKVSIAYVIELMMNKSEDHAMVIDENVKLVGMVTKADLIKYLLKILREEVKGT